MTRFLQSTERLVARDPDDYRAAWDSIRQQAIDLNVRAWMFRAADNPSRFIEFLEWKASGPGALPETLLDSLERLERFGSSVTQQWLEP